MSFIVNRSIRTLNRQLPSMVRGVHIENKVHDTMPFRTKGGYFGLKLAVGSVTGLGLPFFAAYYHGAFH